MSRLAVLPSSRAPAAAPSWPPSSGSATAARARCQSTTPPSTRSCTWIPRALANTPTHSARPGPTSKPGGSHETEARIHAPQGARHPGAAEPEDHWPGDSAHPRLPAPLPGRARPDVRRPAGHRQAATRPGLAPIPDDEEE